MSINSLYDDKITTNEKRIFNILNNIGIAFCSIGKKFNVPKNVDIRKTYHWRYAKALCDKYDEWGFDDSTAEKFTFVVVKVAQQKKLIKGSNLSHIFKTDVLSSCYDYMVNEKREETDIINHIKKSYNFVKNMLGDNLSVESLIARKSIGQLPNIVRWYNQNKVSIYYLSVSNMCASALFKLRDKYDVPSKSELFVKFLEATKDEKSKKIISNTLGSDIRIL